MLLGHAMHIHSLRAVIVTGTRQTVLMEASMYPCILTQPTGIVEVCMEILEKHEEAELDCLSPGQHILVKAAHTGWGYVCG